MSTDAPSRREVLARGGGRVVDLLVPTVRMLRRLRRRVRRTRTAVVIPPQAPGSLGDGAMMESLVTQLKQRGIDQVVSLSIYTDDDGWRSEIDGIDHEFLLPGFFRRQRPRHRLALLRGASRWDCCFAIGADVMDGAYSERGTLSRLRIIRSIAEAGVPTTVCGFSFPEDAPESVVAGLKDACRRTTVLVRDPVSLRRVTDRGVTCAKPVGDLAFLLDPCSSDRTAPVARWLSERRSAGDVVLGVNVNHATLPFDRLELDQAIAKVVDLLQHLSLERRIAVVFVPHDRRTDASDWSMCNRAMELLDARRSGIDTCCLPSGMGPPEIKELMGQVDFVISGRMHVLIAALGEGTPACGIEYQGKMLGLFELFGCVEARITIDEFFFDDGGRDAKVSDLVARRSELGRRIARDLPRVMSMAAANLDAISSV